MTTTHAFEVVLQPVALAQLVILAWNDPLRKSLEDWSLAVHGFAVVGACCIVRVDGSFCLLLKFRLALIDGICSTAYLDLMRDATQINGFSSYGFMLVVARHVCYLL